mmetsp:Transcript_139/g.209  ORF Transcript_139/g.209 Transcript_139/m.209 type:complete len:96 (+) Transcript_139:346-633(+)
MFQTTQATHCPGEIEIARPIPRQHTAKGNRAVDRKTPNRRPTGILKRGAAVIHRRLYVSQPSRWLRAAMAANMTPATGATQRPEKENESSLEKNR